MLTPPVTADAIRKWCSTGGLPHRKTGPENKQEVRIEAGAFVAWVRVMKPTMGLNAPGPEAPPPAQEQATVSAVMTLAKAKAEEATARAQERRVKVDKMLGRLVASADVERVWTAAVANFARGLEKLPDLAIPGLARQCAIAMERLGVKPAPAAAAVEELKALMREELARAVDITRSRLAEGPSTQEQMDHGEEPEP